MGIWEGAGKGRAGLGSASVCDVIFLLRLSRSICASMGSNLNFSLFSCQPCCGEFHRNVLCHVLLPHPSGTPERVSWDKPGSWCHTWRGDHGEPGEGALAGRLPPLLSTAANECWISLPGARTGSGLCPSHPAPSTQTTGRPCWGHHRAIVTPLTPLAGFDPCFISFQRLTKGIFGFQAL